MSIRLKLRDYRQCKVQRKVACADGEQTSRLREKVSSHFARDVTQMRAVAVAMALPSDKPPSYEEATGQQSVAPNANNADEHMEASSLPCPLHVTPNIDPAVPSSSSLPNTLNTGDGNTKMCESLIAEKSQESNNTPPPAGWVLDTQTAKALEAGDYSKEEEAGATKAEEAGESSTSQQTPQASTSGGPIPWGNPPQGSLGQEMSGVWGAPSLSAACPAGFEPALGVAALILRETINTTDRGAQRGAVVLQATGAPMFMLQRTRSHHSTRTRTRALELLDGAGSQVAATFESIKRGNVLSVEVLCPPGSRIARVETSVDLTAQTVAASILNAAEQPVFRLIMPQIGSIETQPTQQVVSVASGGSVGSLEWAWGLEADLYEVRINVPGDLDVRMKIAIIALCALSMEAFSSRWSAGRDSHHGHKHRRRHHKHHR